MATKLRPSRSDEDDGDDDAPVTDREEPSMSDEEPEQAAQSTAAEEEPREDAGAPDPADDGGPDAGASAEEIDVEETVKDLSARLAVVSSHVEELEESGEVGDRIDDLEQRLSQLTSLAEAVSAQYNPFVAENSPEEPSWDRPGPDDEEGDGPAGGDPGGAPGEGGSTTREHGGDPDPPGPGPGAGPGDPAGEDDPEEGGPVVEAVPEMPRPRSFDGDADAPADGFEHRMLLLQWVEHMIERVGRGGLLDLLDYYENLGWLGPGLKDRALKVAVGFEEPTSSSSSRPRDDQGRFVERSQSVRGWRGDRELHARSLIAIERLNGHDVSKARLEEVRMELDRIFGG